MKQPKRIQDQFLIPAWDEYFLADAPGPFTASSYDVFSTIKYDDEGEVIDATIVYDRPAYSAPREYSLSDYFAYQQFWLRTQGI